MQSSISSHIATVLSLLVACSSAKPEEQGVVGRFVPPSTSPAAAAVSGAAGDPGGRSASAMSPGGAPVVPPAMPVQRSTPATATAARAREMMRLDQCPGPLAADQAAALRAADPQPSATRWLYPYQQTVFPRGTSAPVLQWDGESAQAIYIRAHSSLLDYQACFVGTNAPRFALPQDAWDLAGEQSNGPNDPLTVELTLSTGSQVVRLPPLSLTFALANLKSAILAFFLPGQEIESGNIRAFASLEVCRPDGASCDVGIDCCCGCCTAGACACNTQMMCANLDEKCARGNDCCDPALACIGGFCEMVRAPD